MLSKQMVTRGSRKQRNQTSNPEMAELRDRVGKLEKSVTDITNAIYTLFQGMQQPATEKTSSSDTKQVEPVPEPTESLEPTEEQQEPEPPPEHKPEDAQEEQSEQ